MTPRPDDHARTELRDLVAQASTRRDEEHERIETEFWREISRLQKRYHGAQQDIADALGIKRNQILRQTKRYQPATARPRPDSRPVPGNDDTLPS